LGYCNNNLLSGIYSSILVSRVVHALYLEVFFRKVSIKRSTLAPAVFRVVGVGSLVYISLVGLRGFYREVFK
jgi:hypothetical protein